MNCCTTQNNAFSDAGDPKVSADWILPAVFCPKPRRLARPAPVADPVSSLRWLSSHHRADFLNSNAAMDLLDSFLTKQDGEEGEENQAASSPPFFCGSPPCRTSNPVVHDARFVGEDRPTSVAPFPRFTLTKSGPRPESPKQGGCARSKFGLVPAAVRIEGFHCLGRGCGGCSGITATA